MKGGQHMPDFRTLMGTGGSRGVPRVYCDCPVCQEDRTGGQSRRRRCSALWSSAAGVNEIIQRHPWIRRKLQLTPLFERMDVNGYQVMA